MEEIGKKFIHILGIIFSLKVVLVGKSKRWKLFFGNVLGVKVSMAKFRIL